MVQYSAGTGSPRTGMRFGDRASLYWAGPARAIDEAHIFLAPRIIGGAGSLPPIGGVGRENVAEAAELDPVILEQIGGDVYMHGPVRYA